MQANSMNNTALFGRYWSAKSLVHDLDPRTKILGTLALVILLFITQTPWALALLALVILGLFALAHIPFIQALRSIAPLSFIVLLTALLNLFFVQGGAVYIDWGWLTISQDGIRFAIFIAVRLTLLLLTGSLLTLTTKSLAITDAIERLLTPLARFGLPAHEFAFVMGVALRFLPEFALEFNDIRVAQISRGARFSTSPIKGGLSALSSLLVPLFTSVFRHADTLSAAMESRCYHGAIGRTNLHPLHFGKRDAAAALFLVIVFTAVITLNLLNLA